MPSLVGSEMCIRDRYATQHDGYIKKYMENETGESEYLDREHNFFLKNKSGYIIPVISCVKVLFSDFNGGLFMGTFKTDNNTKNMIYIIYSKEGIIQDISSSAISILRIESSQIKKTKINIETIVPKALADKKYRDGKEIMFKPPASTTGETPGNHFL
eukprot:TRINITY_DN5060_c0_g1_i2.p2 TRINITY_DN5060_c0_g1~~TRINITY_DN5060_c0_g1_i2.p2  ORF type:complete len:158 (-),score=38.73 TRINITY_DN5060_c0_g1_i2:72-545(-)